MTLQSSPSIVLGDIMATGRILVATHRGTWVVKMVGDVRMSLCNTIEQCLKRMFNDAAFSDVLVDLTETEGIDSTSLGLLAKLSINTKKRINKVPVVVSDNADINRILQSMGFDERVFTMVTEPPLALVDLQEMPVVPVTEEAARQRVLEAHRILMELNDQNKLKFKDLVAELEKSHSV